MSSKSRTQRWQEAASNAVVGLQALIDIQSEYEEWRNNLPDNLQATVLGEKLDTVCDLDLDAAQETVTEAEEMDLPLGFGRD